MTVLSACKEAAVELNQTEPTTLFSTTNRFAKELLLQANRSAVDIGKVYDWQKLTVLNTMTGDGSTESFPLPSNYDRMPKKQDLHSSQFKNLRFRKAKDLDEWLYLKDNIVTGTPGNWIIISGAFQIFPAMASGETARHYYLSNQTISGNKTAFTADTDAFLFSERLLALSIVWRWRASKRLEYAEDMRNFEIALATEMANDKGSRTLVVGAQRIPMGASLAYPGVLG